MDDMIPMEAITDCKSLHVSVHSTKAVLDKRLRVDIGSLREMLSEKRLSDVKWINTERQLADILTKSGPSAYPLQLILSKGQLFL